MKKTEAVKCLLSFSGVFSDISPQARGTQEKINKWGHIKLKQFCTAKEPINKQKDNLLKGGWYLQMIYLIRG